MNYLKKIKENTNLYNDNIGFIEQWDFSLANTCQDARVEAITKIASICYDNPSIVGKVRLFDMLACESVGLPSTSFEYVPILLDYETYVKIINEVYKNFPSNPEHTILLDIQKYGQWVIKETEAFDQDEFYLLTNLRACLTDTATYGITSVNFKTFFNTDEEELELIRENSNTYFMKIPIFVARQLVRHREQLLQELSRRYTSDKQSPIEFYEKDGDKELELVNLIALTIYNKKLEDKWKPEDARAILGSGLYTKIWSGWNGRGIENFLKLRTKDKAQKEIRLIAEQMEKW